MIIKINGCSGDSDRVEMFWNIPDIKTPNMAKSFEETCHELFHSEKIKRAVKLSFYSPVFISDPLSYMFGVLRPIYMPV